RSQAGEAICATRHASSARKSPLSLSPAVGVKGRIMLARLTGNRPGNEVAASNTTGRVARREQWAAYLFISPCMLWLILFIIAPVAASIVISLTNYSLVFPWHWIGLQNYYTMIHDSIFWQSLATTLTFVLYSVPLYLVVGLGLSLLLNMKRRGVNLFRTIIF